MGSIKKQKIKAYILMESLMATGLFVLLTSLVLSEVTRSRQSHEAYLQVEESYQLAQMALQTGQEDLTLNESRVHVMRSEGQLTIQMKGEESLVIQK